MTGNHAPTLYPRPRFYLTLKDMSVIAAHPYRLFPTIERIIAVKTGSAGIGQWLFPFAFHPSRYLQP